MITLDRQIVEIRHLTLFKSNIVYLLSKSRENAMFHESPSKITRQTLSISHIL